MDPDCDCDNAHLHLLLCKYFAFPSWWDYFTLALRWCACSATHYTKAPNELYSWSVVLRLKRPKTEWAYLKLRLHAQITAFCTLLQSNYRLLPIKTHTHTQAKSLSSFSLAFALHSIDTIIHILTIKFEYTPTTHIDNCKDRFRRTTVSRPFLASSFTLANNRN